MTPSVSLHLCPSSLDDSRVYFIHVQSGGPSVLGLLSSHIIMSSGRDNVDSSPGYLSPMSVCACVAEKQRGGSVRLSECAI